MRFCRPGTAWRSVPRGCRLVPLKITHYSAARRWSTATFQLNRSWGPSRLSIMMYLKVVGIEIVPGFSKPCLVRCDTRFQLLA
jgi:hypothetical protein